MAIFLIGMPAAGKTSYGKCLSEQLNFAFYDLDAEIEKIHGTTIRHLFAEQGEAHFREIERDILHTFAQKKETIVATGGGTACFYDNINFMNTHGTTVWLNTPKETVVARLLADSERPLWQTILKNDIDLNEKKNLVSAFYDKLYAERAIFYAQAQEVSVCG
ncbi:MAG: Shikimate kinase [Bacteroidota bacterium]